MCKAGKQCVSIGGEESLWILPLFILIMYPYACFYDVKLKLWWFLEPL